MLFHSVVEGWLIMIGEGGQPVVAPPDGVDIADCPTAVITAMLEVEKRETMESEEDKLNEIRRQAWEEGYRDCANEFDICELVKGLGRIDDYENMVREKNPYNKKS